MMKKSELKIKLKTRIEQLQNKECSLENKLKIIRGKRITFEYSTADDLEEVSEVATKVSIHEELEFLVEIYNEL